MGLTRLIFIFILISFQPNLPKNVAYSFTKKTLITIGTFGFYPLIESFTKTNEEIIQKAHEKIDYAKLNYEIPISILDQNFRNINETILFNIACSIRSENIETYLDNLKILIKDLYNIKNVLQKRVAKLKKLNYLKDLTTIKEMQNLIQNIELILPNAKFLNLYINNHKDFFKLYDLLKTLYKSYKHEIKLILKKNKLYNFQIKLEKIILKKHLECLYPHLVYTDTIENDILKLNKICEYNFVYTEIIQRLTNLKNKLCTIKNFITK